MSYQGKNIEQQCKKTMFMTRILRLDKITSSVTLKMMRNLKNHQVRCQTKFYLLMKAVSNESSFHSFI